MDLDAAPLPSRADLRARTTDVIDAMLMGSYGRRVREIAQAEIGRAWSDRRTEDAPAVLTAIVDALAVHMHSVHVGEIAVQVVNHLLGGEPAAILAEGMVRRS